MIFFVVLICVPCFAKNPNNTALFSSFLRNCCQFPGRAMFEPTRLRDSFPRFSLLWPLRLSFLYSSQTKSHRLADSSCRLMYGRKALRAYSLNVLAFAGHIMLTMTAPSRITTSLEGAATLDSPCLSRHSKRSDFLQDRSFPCWDNEGEHDWFSCWKNASKLPSLVWQAMNNLENNKQSFWRYATFSFAVECPLKDFILISGSLFFAIRS